MGQPAVHQYPQYRAIIRLATTTLKSVHSGDYTYRRILQIHLSGLLRRRALRALWSLCVLRAIHVHRHDHVNF